MTAKKTVRSLLFEVPRLYDLLTSQHRYRLLHRVGRVHENEFRALRALCRRQDPLVLDVGGNVGQSVLSTFVVLPRARVISFEPNPVNLTSLRALEDRFPGLTVEPVGLSDHVGEAVLYCPSYNGKVMTGLASFDFEAARGWLGPGTVFRFRPERMQIHEYALRVRPMDSYGLEPDIIKIDVQGLEPEVIRGGLATIEASRPVIMVEAEQEGGQADKLLAPLGYRLVGYRDGVFVPVSAASTNRFFVPDELLGGRGEGRDGVGTVEKGMS